MWHCTVLEQRLYAANLVPLTNAVTLQENSEPPIEPPCSSKKQIDICIANVETLKAGTSSDSLPALINKGLYAANLLPLTNAVTLQGNSEPPIEPPCSSKKQIDICIANVETLKAGTSSDSLPALINKGLYAANLVPLTNAVTLQGNSEPPIEPPSTSKKQIDICIANVETLKAGTSSGSLPALINPKWDEQFEINWEYLPRGIADCLNVGRRLNPRDKREFVRFISRAITDVCPRPKRKNLVVIVQKIVNKFPKSLADSWCDETAGIGYESLLRKVVTRIENLNRTMNLTTKYHVDSEGRKKKRLPGYKMYGCSNWQPMIVQEEEEDDLEKKKSVMKDMFANGCRNVDTIVRSLLMQTYKLQRRDINEGCDINNLITDWPFLFTIEGLLGHFNELVGIDVRNKLENALFVKGNRIVAFMSRITDKCFKQEKLRNTLYELLSCGVMPNELISDMSGLLVLIMEYFGETKGSLFVTIESAIPRNEVEPILNMQDISSPLIVVQGQSEFSYENCMLYVNGKIIIDEIKSFKDAFICLFCIYYCLNIDYPLSAAATLEFFQRCFFGINPEYGAKVQKRCKWKMNIKVTKFIEMLSEHEPELA